MKLVVFDLDGTLIDTVSLFIASISCALDKMGQPVPDEKTLRSISGLGMQAGIGRIAPDLGKDEFDELIRRYREESLARASKSRQEELFPGAREVLQNLQEREDFLMAVATGKALDSTERILKHHDIKGLFTSIHTPDTNIAKPHPDMIASAMEIVDADPERTVMIGDTTHDMKMAVAAGVRALGVSWGYHEPDELKGAGADMVIDEMDQLIPAVDRLSGD